MRAGARSVPAISGTRPVLVTGGAGFIGCHIADRLATEGHHVLVYDALLRDGAEENVAWLRRRHPQRVAVAVADIRDAGAVAEAAFQATAVFHLAAQVAVTTSMADPLDDFEVNARGTVLLLDALRRCSRKVPLVFASTNKVYGDLADIALRDTGTAWMPAEAALRTHGIDERRPVSFHTPYGCSKGAADQYVLDYARSFGLPTVVLRMSCIYGRRQRGTEDQGWVAHFLLRALAGDSITLYGDGRQVRDILFVDDAVDAYVAAWRRIERASGQAFNLGGGPANAVSLLQIIRCIEETLGVPVDVQFADWRPGDQRYYVSDTRRIRKTLGLAPALGWREGLAMLADWFAADRSTPARAPRRPVALGAAQ